MFRIESCAQQHCSRSKSKACFGAAGVRAKVPWKAWPLVFLELQKILEKQWPMLRGFQTWPRRLVISCYNTIRYITMLCIIMYNMFFHTKFSCNFSIVLSTDYSIPIYKIYCYMLCNIKSYIAYYITQWCSLLYSILYIYITAYYIFIEC